ncbi:hypothetical protein N7463_004025 [Penicillium fimorum]|uniref:Uncharacterized protein n=1 Tax=Penicillium fimorum TaxID=1882269 RepID=A0A9X0C9V0_9EURO|nr:hypothetical protein N7463_004025 [Penicillium fimorum]
MKGFIGGIPVALLAVAAQAKFAENQAGGTAIGGPTGIDNSDGGFISPNSASIKPDTQLNEWNEDGHPVKLHDTDVYPRPSGVAVPFGHPGFPGGPQVPGMGPFGKRGGPAGSVFGRPNSDHDESHGPPAHGGAPHGVHFEPHAEPHYAPHTESHNEPHPEPHYENHPEPHVENHPEPHYAPHYSPTYAPHYEPHTTLEHDLTSVKDNNNGPTGGKISFSRRGFPGAAPGPHFEGHPKPQGGPHIEPHSEPHYEPHAESHYEPHPEPHYVNHPEPHVENHPEPHYAPHYSPTYAPHYEPHTTLEHDLTSVKDNNNGPTAGKISFSRRGFPGAAPGPHFEGHPKPQAGPHFEPHSEPHYEPHAESHYEPHPEPHYVNHPEPHVENHPEPHYAPHYSPTYAPHYEPHTTLEHDLTSVKDNNNGPTGGKISFSRRGFPGAAPGPHFEGHPKPQGGPHIEPHSEPHYEPHAESHYEPHPEPHYENHPEPHVHNHPEPHYAPHYSPTYAPHYEPHTTLEHDLTSVKDNNNGPTGGKISFSRRGFPGAAPGPHFEGHPKPQGGPHIEPHSEPHYEPHAESHYEPHPEPHYENHPEPHVHNHPEPHYAPHYSPTYAPHYEPHTTLEHDLTSVKDNNNGPTGGKISFSRRGFPGAAPGPHFEGHPKPQGGPHIEPHSEPHYEPHAESHYEPHPEPHYVNHPEPHVENHPEPHYEPHYSPSYKPHYEPHNTLEEDLTLVKDNNNGPTAGKISFSRRGFPGAAPGPHIEPHSEPHYEPHAESHYEPHAEPHYVNHPEPHVENHPEPHHEPHYSPTYAPHYEPHHTLDDDRTWVKNNKNGPTAGEISFSRRAYAPAPEADAGSSDEDHADAPQCAAQVHEVVRTVTRTQYKPAEETHVAYQSPPIVEAGAIPVLAPHHSAPVPAAAVPTSAAFSHSPKDSAGADPLANYAASAPSHQHSAGADPLANYAPSASHNHASHPPMSQTGDFSKIPVQVPVATPVANGGIPQATSSHGKGKMVPSGAFAEQNPSPSSSASASVSHGIMFQGDAARLSGGIISAAAAVMGVLAFIL